MHLNKMNEYMEKYNVSSLCAKVLDAMHLEDSVIEDIFYSNKTLFDIDDTLVKDIVLRIQKAKINNEKVLVCGDYDCDGICATTILYDALLKYGIECGYYIPNRFTQGYGLHVDTVDMAHEKGYSLLITVDNGVKAIEALRKAKQYGMDIILSDHHSYEENDLVYDYFLHPNILPTFYEKMCGASVAFLIAKALVGLYENHIILAGIATIGDVVPLFHLNRLLVKECIALLNNKRYPFIQMLANDTSSWDEKKIAFQIVPKMNSVGRLADRANVNNVVRMLLLEDIVQIQNGVVQINRINDVRKKLSESMEKCAQNKLDLNQQFYVLYDESFHEGLNGIVASRFLNKTNKPVMVLSLNNDILKGSIRSNTIDLTTYFDPIKDELIAYGGHKEAAGISFSKNKLKFIENYVNNNIDVNVNENTICTIEVTKDDINFASLQSLQCLKPFGCGFEMPLFKIKDTNIKVQTLGDGSHLKYVGDEFSYLYFNQKDRYEKDYYKNEFTFVGNFEINTFRNKKSINMIVEFIDE